MSGNKIKITVFVTSNGTHLHQIYSALYFLSKHPDFEVAYCARRGLIYDRPNRQFLEIVIQGGKALSSVRVIYDLQDSPEIGLPSALEGCDFYFKRSFEQSTLNGVANHLRNKVKPYGLHYRVFDSDKWTVLRRLCLEMFVNPVWPWKRQNQFHLSNIKDMLDKTFLGKQNNLVSSCRFEKSVGRARNGILFQCRLWDPQDVLEQNRLDTEQVNISRMELVRRLKREFGEQFIGGIQPTKYAKEVCPELISEQPTDRESYLSLIERSLIVICSRGLLDSNGGKVAEAIALGKCVVAERIRTKLPDELKPGVNYLSFETEGECIEHVKALIQNPSLVESMENQNLEYYRRALKPEKLIVSHLKIAGAIC